MLQCLIVFDYLRRPNPKAKKAKIPVQFMVSVRAAPMLPPRPPRPTCALRQNQLEAFQKRVRKLLERTPPAGQAFSSKVLGAMAALALVA